MKPLAALGKSVNWSALQHLDSDSSLEVWPRLAGPVPAIGDRAFSQLPRGMRRADDPELHLTQAINNSKGVLRSSEQAAVAMFRLPAAP